MASVRSKRRRLWNRGHGRSLLLVFSAAVLALPLNSARTDSLLHQLGEAMKQDYRETRKLGAHPTPTQLAKVRRDTYNPVIARGISEGRVIVRDFRKKLTNSLFELRARMFADIYNPKGAAGLKAVGGASSGAASGAAARSGQNRPAATAAGGAEGAKAVNFNGKKAPEKAPTVDSDGIIQDR